MADYEIRIFIDNGKLEYSCQIGSGTMDARSLLVGLGSTVRWICESGDYAIQFANNTSPLDDGSMSLSKPGGQPTAECRVTKRKFSLEPFKYTVAVHVSGADPRILVDDPIIIVDDAAP